MQILGRGVPVSAFGSRYAKPSSLRPLVLEPQISCKRLMGHHGKRHVADELHICSELVLPPRALRNAVWFGAVGLQWQESAMKNPFLSMWLSAANRAAGPARGFWTAEMRRQQKAMLNEAGHSLAQDRATAPKKRATSKRRQKTSR